MRGATKCARRLKTLFSSLRSKLGKVPLPAAGDPVTQCILGILSRDVPESKAREALDGIRGLVVDFNELRVVPPIELAQMLGEYPDVRLKSEDISRVLNKIFALHHNVTLDHLAGMSRKDLIAYLEGLDGLEPYTRARVRLLALQQHAIPLDEAMWAYARRREIVDNRCPLGEAQAFLERQIAEGNALEFFALLNRQAWSEMATAVGKREVARILSVPPDRTTRNMLAAFGTASPEEPAQLESNLGPEGPADQREAVAVSPSGGASSANPGPKRKPERTSRTPAKKGKKQLTTTESKRASAVPAKAAARRPAAKGRRPGAAKAKR
jgi:hypothetical protein